MKKMIATLRSVALVFLAVMASNVALADDPPDNVAGNWTIYSDSVSTGLPVVKNVQIAQYGNRITGYFEGPNQSGPIQGEVKVHEIKFSTVTPNVLSFKGQIYGGNMSGTFSLHGRHAPWQAVRAETVAVTAPATAAAPAAAASSYPYQPAEAASAPAPQPAPQVAPQSEPQPATTTQTESNAGPTPALQTPEQLDALVAPIALYPDALVAQVLAAASYPEQVAFADYWIAQNKTLTGAALTQAVDQEPWDPSVKALTVFPSVLHTLAANLTWTSNLGQAFHDQQADVMAAVQVMRAKAHAAGTLVSTPQIQVIQQSPSTIVIQPANPEVVYVPQYNPAVVYGVPYFVPAFRPPVVVTAASVSFGAGVAVGAVFGGGGFIGGGVGFGWGWHAWGCNWGGGGGGGTVIYNHTTYVNKTVNNWHGANYNNYHPWGSGPHGNGPYAAHSYDPHGWTPNGGYNGNHGLIGGNGGVQHANAANSGRLGSSLANNSPANNRSRSQMAGDGRASRMESNRGRYSMNRGREMRASHEHMGGGHRSFGGGGHRR